MITKGLTVREKFSPEFNDFVSQCLTQDPQERPNAEALLNHPFIKKSQGRRLLAELVANSIDMIEAYREERAASLRDSSQQSNSDSTHDFPFFHNPIKKDIPSPNFNDENYEFNETGTTKIHFNLVTNDSGTMIMKNTPDNSSGKNSGEIDLNSQNTGSLIYHKDAEDSTSNGLNAYMKMFRELNQKYEGDPQDMEAEVAEICRYLSFNQRQADISSFLKKKENIQAEMEAEMARVRQKYQEKLSMIDKILEHKQQLEFMRTKFKELGVDINELECMKDIGEKGKLFKRADTYEIHEPSATNPLPKLDKGIFVGAALGGNKATPTGASTSQIMKKFYKLGEKNRMNAVNSNGESEPVASILSNGISKLKKMNSNDKNNLSSRNMLSKGSGSPSNQTPKGSSQAEKKNQLSSKNLLSKKPLVSYLAEKNKMSESSSDKIIHKPKK